MNVLKRFFAKSSMQEPQLDTQDEGVYFLKNIQSTEEKSPSIPVSMSIKEIADYCDIEIRQVVAVLDIKTPIICALLDGVRFQHEKLPQMPHASGCRCVEIPVWEWDEVLHGDRPENGDRRGTVSANIKFVDWFDGQSDEFQLKYLGELRYRLFKNGCALKNFADMTTLKALSDVEIMKFNID